MHIEHIAAQPPFVTPTFEQTIGIVRDVYGPGPVRVKVDMFMNAVGQTFMRRAVGRSGVVDWSMVVERDRHCPFGTGCQLLAAAPGPHEAPE